MKFTQEQLREAVDGMGPFKVEERLPQTDDVYATTVFRFQGKLFQVAHISGDESIGFCFIDNNGDPIEDDNGEPLEIGEVEVYRKTVTDYRPVARPPHRSGE